MRSRLLIGGLLGVFLINTGGWKNATDITGTWEITVERSAEYSGNFTSTLVFKQAGDQLSGTYSGKFGEYKVIGTVEGDKVVFSWEQKPPTDGGKRPRPVTFDGKLESPTKMTGTVVAFCQSEKCKWTATKKK
jgi:hypothetical protein